MSRLHSYLLRRRGSNNYYYRRRIPRDIQLVVGKPLVYQSLHTHRLSDALFLADMYTGYLDALFEQARKMTTPHPDDLLRRIAAGESFSTLRIRERGPDGSEVDIEITPADIKGMRESGMTGDQVHDFLQAAARRGRVAAALGAIKAPGNSAQPTATVS